MANLVITPALVVGRRPALRGTGLGAQALTAGLAVYRDGQLGWKPAAAGASTTRGRTPQGLALNAAGADQPFVVQRCGLVDLGSNVLTPGAVYYLSPTAGKLCPLGDLTEDDAIVAVGMAFSARLFNINILTLDFGAGAVDAAPVNTVLPLIIGSAVVGETLTVDLGEWDNSPDSYAVQWRLGGVAISGETDDDYPVDDADEGGVITVTVTATNSIGSTSATSLGTDPVEADAPAVPVNSVAPVITGTAQVGETLTRSTGTWSNTPTSYATQWKRDGANIGGATGSTYDLVEADEGAVITVTVTASNAGGAGSPATSAGTATVIPEGSSIPEPVLDLDFTSSIPSPELTYNQSRASTATDLLFLDTTTAYNSYSNNVPRFVRGGFLVEEARTQYLLNNEAPANQTVTLTAGRYCLWMIGAGSVAVAAGTAVGTGFGSASQNTPVIFVLSADGTVAVTKTGTVGVFQLEGGPGVCGAPGPTSFIPTTSAPVTRAFDYWRYALTGYWDWHAGTQTMDFTMFSGGTGNVNNHVSGIHTTNAGTTLALFHNNNLTPMSAVMDGAGGGDLNYSQTITFNDPHKSGSSWGTRSSLSFDGDTPEVTPLGAATDQFDCGLLSVLDQGVGLQGGSAIIRRWTLYDVQITGADLASLTA